MSRSSGAKPTADAVKRPRRASPPARDSAVEPGLHELRSSIANLRAAAEALALAAVPRPASSARASRPAALLAAVIEEAERASRAVDRLAAWLDGPGAGKAGANAVSAAVLASEIARQAARELDLAVDLAVTIDEPLTVPLSFARPILGALGRLRREFSVGEIELSARRHADLLALEFAFSAREPESSRLREQHHQVLAGGAHGEPSLADEARAAGGEAWLAIRRGEATFSLRLLLPIAAKP
jgi:hypothetical protein